MSQQNASKNMYNIEKQSIRLYFYMCSLLSVILLAVVLSFVYIRSFNQEFGSVTNQLSASIVEEKKRFLRTAVELTLYLIEHEREQVGLEYAGKNYSEKQRKAICVERVSKLIRELRLIDEGYIWVNEIVNYEGGDKYAIRRIHPNLPHTEGMWLSTQMTDIMGARPYEVELNGIKQHGELFFDYYFKKMSSGQIAHKLSFAKLYKPYDWVVATGVYLDDVDQLIQAEQMKIEQASDAQRRLTFSIAIAVVLLATASIAFFEKQFTRLVSNYEQRIGEYTATLEELSSTDKLTGLHNRLKLDEMFAYELSQAQRYEKSFSVLLIDIDRFKDVNDTYGHQVGDQILVEFSKLLKSNSRSTESLGRWGGEEFLVILPETTAAGAMTFAEKIRQLVGAHEFPVAGTVTCSIGVSTFHKNDSRESMLDRADKALYCAKGKGRNTVLCEISPPSA